MMKEREDFFSINQKIRSKVIVDKKKNSSSIFRPLWLTLLQTQLEEVTKLGLCHFLLQQVE